MASEFNIRPGVYMTFEDKSQRPPTVNTSRAVSVFASDKGPLNPALVTSTDKHLQLYGKPTGTSFAHYHNEIFLKVANSMYCHRVIGANYKFAAGVFVNNKEKVAISPQNPTGFAYAGTSFTALSRGSEQEAGEINRQIYDIIFSGDLTSAHSVGLTVNAVALTATAFSLNHNNTLKLLSQKIKTALDNIAGGSTVEVVNREGQNRIIRVIAPQDTAISLTAALATGAAAPTLSVIESEYISWVVAENPGTWGNNVGVTIGNINQGVNAKKLLTFNSNFAANHAFTATINGVNIGPVAYATSHLTTMANIMAAISTALPNYTVTAQSNENTNRNIVITAPDAFTEIEIQDVTVNQTAAGAASPTATVSELIKSQAPVGDFNLLVFENSSRRPDETIKCSLRNTYSDFKTNYFIEHSVNSSGSKSLRIRVQANPSLGSGNGFRVQGATNLVYNTKEGYLGGGSNGDAVTKADIINGWKPFEDTTQYEVRILMNSGYSDPDIQRAITALCELRNDCVGVLDVPQDHQSAEGAANYRHNILGIDSSYVGLYTPDIKFYDAYNDKYVWLPPSGSAAARFAYTDKVRQEWFSAAGLNRGVVNEATALFASYTDGEQDLLTEAQVNYIKVFKGRKAIMGDWTLQYKPSALQIMPVRRLCNSIFLLATESVVYSMYEPNDDRTRRDVKRVVEDFMQPIKDGRGVYTFKVICDKTNNKPTDIDSRNLNVEVIFDPVISAMRIKLTGIITKTGAVAQVAEELRG
jgi:Phage tail sheath protein subtilisin-like domain